MLTPNIFDFCLRLLSLTGLFLINLFLLAYALLFAEGEYALFYLWVIAYIWYFHRRAIKVDLYEMLCDLYCWAVLGKKNLIEFAKAK